jgi:hypothetical protein
VFDDSTAYNKRDFCNEETFFNDSLGIADSRSDNKDVGSINSLTE